MTEQPAASAGATFRPINAAGKFHAVKAAATPTGSWRDLETAAGNAAFDDAAVDPARLLGAPAELIAVERPTRAAPARSACLSPLEIMRAASSVRRNISSAMACRASARANAGVARQALKPGRSRLQRGLGVGEAGDGSLAERGFR